MNARPDEAPAAVPEVCRSCRYGSGEARDCGLIVAGRLDELLAEGPCALEDRLRRVAATALERRGLAAARAEDRVTVLLARLDDRRAFLSRLGFSRLPEFEAWLAGQLAGLLDEEAEAPADGLPAPAGEGPRCGSCRHRARDERGLCGLEFSGDDAASLSPNPWWGRPMARAADPARLDPPCPAHEPWRPGELDPFAGLVETRPLASRRDEAARLVCLALDRLAARDGEALRAAALLRAQALRGRAVADLARETGLAEGEVMRLLEGARRQLAEILGRELGQEPPHGD